MIISSDILHLHFTPDLIEGGIAIACRSLVSGAGRKDGFPLNHLRSIVADVSVGLAFRRHLTGQCIPFKVLGETPFIRSANYDLSLGGHRCELKAFLITRRTQITRLRKDPALLLRAPALLPLDLFASEGRRPDDLHLFAFLLGLLADARRDMDRAMSAGHPVWLFHPLSNNWRCPRQWLPLENLAFKSECESPITVEIGGQNAEREYVTASLELPHGKRIPVEQGFYSLAYLHPTRRPERRIALHSQSQGEATVVSPNDWCNLWIYGMDIFMTGWLSHEEYRRKAKVLNTGMHTLQVEQTGERNLQVMVQELNPLGPLFERLRKWEQVHQASEVHRP
jgi:hypothetical protein